MECLKRIYGWILSTELRIWIIIYFASSVHISAQGIPCRGDLCDDTVTENPCEGLECMAGLPCTDGKCPCPTQAQCDDYSDLYQPVCYNGNTYYSTCHVRAHMCVTVLLTDEIHPGPCPVEASTPGGGTAADPYAKAVLETPGLPLATIIGIVVGMVGFVVLLIVGITFGVKKWRGQW